MKELFLPSPCLSLQMERFNELKDLLKKRGYNVNLEGDTLFIKDSSVPVYSTDVSYVEPENRIDVANKITAGFLSGVEYALKNE